jgi:hypothetical protein
MRHFGNALQHRILYALDDGTDTIRINDQRKKTTSPEHLKGIPHIKAVLHHFLHDWNDKPTESITFFTSYDLDVRNGDRLIKHDYKYFRSLAQTAFRQNCVFFLGQPLVEDGYVSAETYLACMKKVQAHFGKGELLYIPHKRESIGNINRLRDTLGIIIREFDVPIEYQMAVRGEMPKILASFFCTALDNCRIIFGDALQIKAFYLVPEHLLCCHDFVQGVYDYFFGYKNPTFEVVRL